MRKIILYLIVLMAITNIHSLSAQTWSPPMWVSQHDSSLTWYIVTGHGVTVDSSGTPWCGWVVNYSSPYTVCILTSRYNGTWSEPDTIIPFGGFGSCDLTTDANGNVWVVAEDGGLISACFYNGNSWSNLMQVPSQGTCCHYPTAAGDTLGNLYVCWAGGGPGDYHHVWSNAHIQSQWGSPALISIPGSYEEFAYSMTTDKQGRVWVGWYQWHPASGGAIYTRYNDGVWCDTMIIAAYSVLAIGPALTVDTAGNIWAAWTGPGISEPAIYATYYDGNAWSEPMLVSSSTAGGDFSVAIASDNKGMVWLTWMSSDHNIYYSYWNGSTWSSPAPVDTNPAYDSWPRMAFDGERIWVTWISERGDSAGVYASYTYGLNVAEKPIANRISISVLSQNYPNPFKQTTEIRYQITDIQMPDVRSKKQDFSLKIYDVSGRLVKQFPELTNNQSPIIWDGKDESRKSVPSGVYFYHIKAENFKDSKIMIRIN